MNKDKIQVGKVSKRAALLVQEPWWACCPVCPCATGFGKFKTHAEALAAARAHIKFDHADKDFIDGY